MFDKHKLFNRVILYISLVEENIVGLLYENFIVLFELPEHECPLQYSGKIIVYLNSGEIFRGRIF